jgi:hypothetical protein
MKIVDAEVKATKTVRGRINGYEANFASITEWSDTKESASDKLLVRIAQRCDYRSTEVKVESVRGHVGIFSYGLFGDVATRHLWPEDGHVSLSTGSKTMDEAIASFRMHVAQIR